MDRPEHVYQLAGPGLPASFPPLRSTAASPLQTLADGDDDPERRIDEAAKALERRITGGVADMLERTLDLPFGGRRADRDR